MLSFFYILHLLMIQSDCQFQLVSYTELTIYKNMAHLEFDITNYKQGKILLFKFNFDQIDYIYNYLSSSMPICLISPYKNPDLLYQKKYPYIFSQSADVKQDLLFFDYGATLSVSGVHLVQIKIDAHLESAIINNTLHIKIYDIRQNTKVFAISTQIYVKNSTSNEKECVNECQQYYIYKPIANSKYRQCENGTCICNYKSFGEYCQFQKDYITMEVSNIVLLKPKSWKYFALNLDQYNPQTEIVLQISELHVNLTVSFAYNGVVGQDIPTIHQQTYLIKMSNETQQYSLRSQLVKYHEIVEQEKLIGQNQLLIGFVNPGNDAVTFKTLYTFGVQNNIGKFLQDNYVLIIIISANLLSAVIFLCLSLFMKQPEDVRPVNEPVHQTNQQFERRQITRQIKKGFREQFITKFFKAYNYLALIQYYPALNEIEECVICTESFKDVDPAQYDKSINLCSVTPCFHLFHHDCLKKWFLTSKCCPFCREQFSEGQLQKTKKWVNLPQDTQTKHQSPLATFKRGKKNEYINRMKNKINFSLQDEDKLQETVTSQAQINNDCSSSNIQQFENLETQNNILSKSHEELKN